LKTLIAVLILAGAAFAHTVTITWVAPTPAPSPALTSYKIYRGSATGTETFFASVSGTTLTYTDTTVINAHTYFYNITAVNVNGESAHSSEVSATIPGIVVAPTTRTFPKTLTGASSATQNIVITNSSGSSQSVTSLDMTGNFTETDDCGTKPFTLADSAFCTAAVTFSPLGTTKTQTGSMLVNSVDGSAATATFTGTNSAPVPHVVPPSGGQPQTNDVTGREEEQQLNAQWTNGVAPGYAPENCGGLNLCIGSGTAFNNGTMIHYGGGTLALTDNATNYVYLNTGASLAPAKNTSAYACPNLPIAKVTTASGVITAIDDDRNMFRYCP